MYYSGIITLALLSLVRSQIEPTHIVKFKSYVGRASAPDILLGHHRDFLSAIRQQSWTGNITEDLSLNRIDLGNRFNAVEGVFSDRAFLDYLYKQSTVEYVEENQIYKTTLSLHHRKRQNNGNWEEEEEEEEEGEGEGNDLLSNKTLEENTIEEEEIEAVKKAKAADWGLSRINQHKKGSLDEYSYNPSGGHGVNVYILDTGVNVGHQDFDKRALHSKNFVTSEEDNDLGGHGTHVAAKVIGKEYGVSKSATIQSVKVLDKQGSGSTSRLLKGIEHVISVAKSGKSIINLSLSGPHSRLLDDALNELVLTYGIPVFAAAGNGGTDACFFAPSSNPNVFTVGSIDKEDKASRFSNFGDCCFFSMNSCFHLFLFFSRKKKKMKRPASHAGSWYTDDEDKLEKQLDSFMKASSQDMREGGIATPMKNIKAIIAPHAGLSYSGPTAAYAYQCFETENINRIFILGPSHVSATQECLLSKCSSYETYLGDLSLDTKVVQELEKTGLFSYAREDVEVEEHSIEMHLPFVSKVFKNKLDSVKIVPVIVGHLSDRKKKAYGEVFAPYLEDPNTLFVISSDFCHWGKRFRYTHYSQDGQRENAIYLKESNVHKINRPIYESIQGLDQCGIEAIESLDLNRFDAYLEDTENTICGRNPICVLLACLQELKDWKVSAKCLKYAQSSKCRDISDSSVSYASIFIQQKKD
ncbi:memo-like protein-domain-containing protein [Sporodiniella umbellata]|nr:memo-like protein-domain-containing protein [Sporodiniella umbellata]